MKKLYKFYWDRNRSGYIDGLFIANEDIVEDMLDRDVYFGEILGKHSEIHGVLSESDLEIVSEDQEKIEWLEQVIGDSNISGYNPLDYILLTCYECGLEIYEQGDWAPHKIINNIYYCKECGEEIENDG